MERCLVGGIRFGFIISKTIRYQHHGEKLLKGFIPSGLRDKKRPAFKPTFEREWNSILYNTEKRLVESLLKEFVEAIFFSSFFSNIHTKEITQDIQCMK